MLSFAPKKQPETACPTFQKHAPTTTKKKSKPEDFTKNMKQPHRRKKNHPTRIHPKMNFKAIELGH
jgi:hypothetical protein